MPGTAAIAWLAQQQPALFAVLEQRLHAREGVAAGRGVAATAAELETACQMIAQFLQQVGRQQPLGVIPMSDLDQAALRPADADPSILAWIQTYKETAGEVAVAHVSAPVSAEIARVMQQVVGILLDPLSSMQTA